MGEIIVENQNAVGARDYGTNCLDCERYKRVGEVCVLEHGKRHLSDYCRDFEPKVELPDYNELMQSVKQDMALQRVKERGKKEKEKKIRLKERAVRKEEKRRMRISRARKRYLAKEKKKEQARAKRKAERLKASGGPMKSDSKMLKVTKKPRILSKETPRPKTEIPFSQASFVSDAEPQKKAKKSHSSKTPSTASSASATA
ncbi:MAG: hypothetical protein ACYC7D_10765 [Nitrososphaerales archaeon]